MKWGAHDIRTPHIHFGPLAVAPEAQGRGVGSALLTHFCNYLDQTTQTGYLETDKEINVGLYEKFGFAVVSTDRVIGVPNWFMQRPPKEVVPQI